MSLDGTCWWRFLLEGAVLMLMGVTGVSIQVRDLQVQKSAQAVRQRWPAQ